MELTGKFESEQDLKSSPTELAQRWGREIEASQKFLEKWHRKSERIVKKYLDEREADQDSASNVNMFWSTVQVLLAQLYSKPPKADVSRSYYDANDDAARVAGVMLQRILNKGPDGLEMDNAFKLAIEDYLVVGFGQVWARYELETEEIAVEGVVDELGNPITQEVVAREEACLDYVYWKDFFWSPARTWSEVRWVARRVYMTKDALKGRFGEKIASMVPMVQRKTRGQNASEPVQFDPWAKAEVFEIWCKDQQRVYWYSPGCEVILDHKADTLEVPGFFPCPRPLMANVTTTKLMPRAMYSMAEDQFEELNELNTRIAYLTRAAKVVGVYDKTAEGVQRMLNQGVENQLIPVDNWAMFAEAGGIKGRVDFMPLDQIVGAIDKLRMYRQDKVQQIYEVLGISDIMRGASRASETAQAQQIKAQFGSARLQLQQTYVGDWAAAAMRLRADIICDLWQPESIKKASVIDMTPDGGLADAAVQLLKNEGTRVYRITIDTDAMASVDYSAERDAAVQFLSGLGAFVSQVAPMVEKEPAAGPYLLQMLQWGMSKFRISKEIEGSLDQAINAMKVAASRPKPPAPDPRVEVEKLKIASAEKIAAMKASTDEQVAALKAAVDLQKIELGARFDQMAMQMQAMMQMMGGAQMPAPVPPQPSMNGAGPEMPAMPQ